jgi:hypothetical protein
MGHARGPRIFVVAALVIGEVRSTVSMVRQAYAAKNAHTQ